MEDDMVFVRRKFVLFGLILALTMVALPEPALADGIVSVTPGSIVNNVDNTITVSLTGAAYAFQNGAVVLLDGYAISANVLTSGVLTAVIPAGFAPGTYNVIVRNPDNSEIPCDGSCSLKVNAYVPPPPTATLPFARPQMIVKSSWVNVERITTGNEFRFAVDFENAGNMTAFNAQAVFTSADLVPLRTGGVVVLGNIAPGSNISIDQRFVSAASLSGKTFVLIDVTVNYYDDKGSSYSDKFTLTVPVGGGGGGGTGVIVTPTPTGVRSGQLIIPSYAVSIDPLQPGSQFTLSITVQNTGNDKAQRVTMIVGGGSSGGSEGGTPQPGGVSGGSGEFTNFAPLGTSNIQALGDIPAGGVVQASQDLIVNVSTNPGAYPMKITFSYINGNGDVVNDEQVITLLVFSLPNVEISFYRPPDPFLAGQPAPLPIQIVNLGKRTAVLGTMTVTAQGGVIENGTSLVGSLDAGGYFTLDPLLFPDTSGVVTLNIVIDYTDDFNRPRTIEKTLEVTVEEGFIEPPFEPGMGEGNGGEFPPSEETFLQKVWRFILGLFGLDSAPPPSTPDMQSPPQFEPEAPMPGGGSGPKG
jgi:hypothetical protein